jgi:hypothetical protein
LALQIRSRAVQSERFSADNGDSCFSPLPTPKSRTAAHAYLIAFIEEMKRSGFVAEALARHRIKGAAVAALTDH